MAPLSRELKLTSLCNPTVDLPPTADWLVCRGAQFNLFQMFFKNRLLHL